MLRPWTAIRTIFALAIMIAASATYASADTLTLTSPILMSDGSWINSLQFSDASIVADGIGNQKLHFNADGTGRIGYATDTTMTYNLYLNVAPTPFAQQDYLFMDNASAPIFNQYTGPDSTITFFTDQAGISVQITNSWLDLSGPIRKWFIPGEAAPPPPCCGGSTWKFVNGVGEVVYNTQDMELDFPPIENVPEPGSFYLIAVGLGFGTQLIRRARRQSR